MSDPVTVKANASNDPAPAGTKAADAASIPVEPAPVGLNVVDPSSVPVTFQVEAIQLPGPPVVTRAIEEVFDAIARSVPLTGPAKALQFAPSLDESNR
ncbi:MAG TPA: hypothetical protein VMG81_03675 [Thermoplasmata archaeon]|nr:hypothetical protein [Thermoplasmata archaeon]